MSGIVQYPSLPRRLWKEYGSTALIMVAGVTLVLVIQSGALQGPHPLEGQPAPAVVLAGLDGTAIDLGEYIGKEVIVLDFWASWCGPCQRSLPEMERLAAKYGDADLVFYAVNVMEPEDTVRNYLAWAELETLPVALDLDGSVATTYRADGIPQTVIIDRGGMIVSVYQGYGSGDGKRLRKEINQLLAGP